MNGCSSNTLYRDPCDSLSQNSRKAIRQGSKSFSFASLFLTPQQRRATHVFYAWCRHADNQIDLATDKEDAFSRLTRLKQGTTAALENLSQQEDVFEGLRWLKQTYAIPNNYFFDLLQGLEDDVMGKTYPSFEALSVYCYRVAGTVGLAMCHILGVSQQKAWRHAVHLGMAMQLTNIARDVFEDFLLGRVYLPTKSSLFEIKTLNLVNTCDDRTFLLITETLREAERHYLRGFAGVRYLPFRAGLAVLVAGFVYRRIGIKILRKGPARWRTRAVVSWGEKWLCCLQCLPLVFRLLLFKKQKGVR